MPDHDPCKSVTCRHGLPSHLSRCRRQPVAGTELKLPGVVRVTARAVRPSVSRPASRKKVLDLLTRAGYNTPLRRTTGKQTTQRIRRALGSCPSGRWVSATAAAAQRSDASLWWRSDASQWQRSEEAGLWQRSEAAYGSAARRIFPSTSPPSLRPPHPAPFPRTPSRRLPWKVDSIHRQSQHERDRPWGLRRSLPSPASPPTSVGIPDL